jgi:UDP-N-acetylglucosamine--N-acetylmuramyl-(pentapeptide) pyrophosphoryl-undecaprenol N-acetylglucosamine transferase
MPAKLLVAAGGTGGHLYPALAVAEQFMSLAKDASVTFVGTARGLESRIVPRAGFPLELVRAAPLRGGSIIRKLRGALAIFPALLDAAALLRRIQPSVVMGVGAYVSGTVLLVAALGRLPTLILEQNAEPGLTNRWLGPFVDEAACAWEETTRHFGRKGFVTGNPVRESIFEVPALVRSEDIMRVLVFGGSQGSTLLNRVVTASLPHLEDYAGRIRFVHQTGPRDLELVTKAYAESKVSAEVTAYIDAMDEAYAGADLVVSRAGATTCAELAACGRPALLIPLSLAGGHQERNAEMMASAGAARFIRESSFDPERLASELIRLFESPDERMTMAERARSLARPGAARTVAERLVALSEQKAARS